MKRPNIGIIEIEDTNVKVTEKRIQQNYIIFSNLKKEMLIKVQKAHRKPNRLEQKKTQCHIMTKNCHIRTKKQ